MESGRITGTVMDAELGEALIGANIVIEGTLYGAATDINGKYIIEGVPTGKYNLTFSSIGFAKSKVTDVIVDDGGTTNINIILKTESFETDEVVITAKAVNNTEASLLVKRQKALAVSDAISAEQFGRSGSSNAAEAVKQVVGASVVDGKHVYVRGLGDRYTSTQLNGAEIPSVDPYKRAGAIDLIPSGLVDNIQAVKSFTADKPGNFSGGSVDIKTKDFPDKLNFTFSTDVSYNSQSTFKGGALTYEGSSSDWLGMGAADRDIPNIVGSKIYTPSAGKAQRDANLAKDIDSKTKAFNSQMSPTKRTAPINQSYSISIGNQVNLFERPLGFLASLSYKRDFSSYKEGHLNRWARGVADQSKTQLDTTYSMNDTRSVDEVLWGGVVKVSYKLNRNHILSVNGLYNRNGESTARYISGSYPYDIDPDWKYEARTLQYKERALGSFQLSGEHYFASLFNAKVNWQGSYMESSQDEPDNRYFYNYVTPDNLFGIKSNLPPERYFRYTDENQRSAQVDVSIPFKQWSEKKGTIKFGSFYANKNRTFRERRFTYQPVNKVGTFLRENEGDINSLFSDEYLGWTGTDTLPNGIELNRIGMYIQETDQTSSNYGADREIAAGYAMIDLPLFENIRMIAGARFETTDMGIVSRDTNQVNGGVNTRDLLPAFSLIYSPTQAMNIRASYGKTLARPSFREISPFTNYDFNGGDTYVGNPELKRTLIDNFDLRWEWYIRPGEVFAMSGFYKKFSDPIELKIDDAVNQVMTWTNVNEAIVYGLEIEARTRLDIISDDLRNFHIGGNLSLIESEVDIDKMELESIKAYEPDAEMKRPFQGQSPYILNAYLNYDNIEAGWTASIFYNVFGERLAAVGSVGAPDVYEQPFHMLNVSVSKRVIERLTLKLSAKNLLDSDMEKTQEFKGKEYIYSSHKRGITLSAGIRYSL